MTNMPQTISILILIAASYAALIPVGEVVAEESKNVIMIEPANQIGVKALYYSTVHHVMMNNSENQTRLRFIKFGGVYTDDFEQGPVPLAFFILHRNTVWDEPKGFQINAARQGNFAINVRIPHSNNGDIFNIQIEERDCLHCAKSNFFVQDTGEEFRIIEQ